MTRLLVQRLWLGLLALLVCIPLMGRLSDRIGRKPLPITCCLAFVLVPYPIFLYLLGGVGLAVEALRWLLIIALVLVVASFFTGARGRSTI